MTRRASVQLALACLGAASLTYDAARHITRHLLRGPS